MGFKFGRIQIRSYPRKMNESKTWVIILRSGVVHLNRRVENVFSLLGQNKKLKFLDCAGGLNPLLNGEKLHSLHSLPYRRDESK